MLKVIYFLTIPISFAFLVGSLFEYSKFYNISKSLDSTMINNIYSEKFVESTEAQNIMKKVEPNILLKKDLPKKIVISKFKEINKKNEIISNDYISSNLKNNFSKKKLDFINTLLPLIAYENKKIILERQKLFEIKQFLVLEKTLSKKNIEYLNNISKKYKIVLINKHKIDVINELLINVNIIPKSIVLAQAANESGWGTSRFAKDYNALFGQYTYDENQGVIPFDRDDGKKHLIKYFSSINKSVESYILNINTHIAYKEFRDVRHKLNNKNIKYKNKKLIETLSVYAEDRSYVETIKSIIKSNDLEQFDLSLHDFIKS